MLAPALFFSHFSLNLDSLPFSIASVPTFTCFKGLCLVVLALQDIIFIEWIISRSLTAGIVDSRLWIKVIEVFPCLYREAIHLQCFPPTHYVSGRGTYERDNLYPICSKLQYRKPGMHVALSPGIILSFAVLNTEKLAFQCATLLWVKAMNLAVLCGDFRTIFFCLVCRSLEKKGMW